MYTYDNEFWNWVGKHRSQDTARLRLARKPDSPEWIEDAISQIENERRARSKFGTTDATRLIPKLMPIGISVEQASSARVARLHYDLSGLKPGVPARVLDMTCGLGVDASFLASDSATKLTALDLDAKIAAVAKANFKSRPNIEIIHGDSVEYLRESNETFDLIFIDPARRDSTGGRVYNLHDCTPDVTTLLPLMLSHARRVMIKMSPMLDVTQTLRDLRHVRNLCVVDERGECRELLAIIDRDTTAEPVITAWSDGISFSFTPSDETNATAVTAIPAPGNCLLEPSPALMKAAPFRLLCSRFNAAMIHPNTHLYLSAHRPGSFPGRINTISEILPFSSSNIRHIARRHLSADVAVRNFPVTADVLRSRLGIRKSGATRIMGITACDGNRYLLFLE